MKWKSLAIACFLAVALDAFATEERCGPHELTAALRLATPSYSDAMILKQDLSEDGFEVECILESKMNGMFGDDQLGWSSAALFRTARGDFEVLFLPAPLVFDSVEVKEQRNGQLYGYSFSGDPRYGGGPIDSNHRIYFVKRGNKLFMANGAGLAAALTNASMR